MQTITQRQYAQERAALLSNMEFVTQQLEQFRTEIHSNPRLLTAAECEAINGLHDARGQFEQAIHDLDRRWETRHWTAHDWQQWDLVTRNVD